MAHLTIEMVQNKISTLPLNLPPPPRFLCRNKQMFLRLRKLERQYFCTLFQKLSQLDVLLKSFLQTTKKNIVENEILK